MSGFLRFPDTIMDVFAPGTTHFRNCTETISPVPESS
jgi:hypothetical protein